MFSAASSGGNMALWSIFPPVPEFSSLVKSSVGEVSQCFQNMGDHIP